MRSDLPNDALEELIRDALEATAVLDDSRELEPFLFLVLEALKENPDLRDGPVQMFLSELERSRTFVVDLLAYCMHELPGRRSIVAPPNS